MKLTIRNKAAKQQEFDKKLEESFRNLEMDFAQIRIKRLKAEIEELRKKENHTRDLAALTMLVEISKEVPDPEKASEDAYRVADAFMRVRDKGKSYQEDILETLKETAANATSNEELGAKVRILLTKYTN